MARYRIDPNDTWRDASWWDGSPAIKVETRDVIETSPHGVVVVRTWKNGASRVRCKGKRTQVFIGEMAWAKAESLANDYEWEARNARDR